MYQFRFRKAHVNLSIIALLLLLLVSLLTGCTGAPSPSQSRAQPTVTLPAVALPTITLSPQHIISDSVSACSLVSAQQIEQAIKIPVTVEQPEQVNGKYPFNDCEYHSLSGNGSVGLTLRVFHNKQAAKEAFTETFSQRQQIDQDPKSISGLGDQAFIGQKPFPILYVLKDNAFIIIGLALPTDTTGYSQEETHIAQFALQNM